jgi:hypothetical protein
MYHINNTKVRKITKSQTVEMELEEGRNGLGFPNLSHED